MRARHGVCRISGEPPFANCPAAGKKCLSEGKTDGIQALWASLREPTVAPIRSSAAHFIRLHQRNQTVTLVVEWATQEGLQ